MDITKHIAKYTEDLNHVAIEDPTYKDGNEKYSAVVLLPSSSDNVNTFDQITLYDWNIS